MTSVLVTGASGFIGSAIVRRLQADGHGAIAFDGDLLADIDLADVEASHCIHAAWYTKHADYLTNPINSEWVSASLRLADAFRLGRRGRRFVVLGTCLEYALAHAAGPCSESKTPLGAETVYAQAKLRLFRDLSSTDRDFAWARVFFVYGPGDRNGRLVPAMMRSFLSGERAGPKFGGLRRDYIHVDDLAAQVVRIAMSDVRGAVNTGTGDAPTLSEIFVAGARATGRPDLAQGNGETGGQPPLIQADLDRFRRAVGAPCARTVTAGLEDLVQSS